MEHKHKEVESFWAGWGKAFMNNPKRTFILALSTILLVVFCTIAVGYLSGLGARLASVESSVNQSETQITTITNRLTDLDIHVNQAVSMKQEVS